MNRILLMVPTAMERDRLLADEQFRRRVVPAVQIELCGWGVVAAGILAARAIARHKPDRAVLAGIAGTLAPERLAVGQAVWFDSVALDGIGVGSSASFQSALELGWELFPEPAGAGPEGEYELTVPAVLGGHSATAESGRLLTVCAAAADPASANSRSARYPGVIAEDMESYPVAAACRLAGIPLSVCRGISNLAGNRRHSTWQTSAALRSVAEELAGQLPRLSALFSE